MKIQEQFASQVMRAFEDTSSTVRSHFVTASAASRESGHPDFADLDVGEQRSANIASVFLDLSNFTGRTYWDPPDQVAYLADAVLSGFTLVVNQFGGHVLGLRGDGLYAGFGPTQQPGVSAALACAASAVAVDGVLNHVNPLLESRGIARVQARAGIDFGEVMFVRSGIPTVNEVNVIGFSANFAAKSEKIADAWEIIVGQQLVDQLEAKDLFVRHENSPKTFTRLGDTRLYHYYRYSWAGALQHIDGVPEHLHGALENSGY